MAGLRNSLQLRAIQTHTLTMTPQLQQAIRLLQLSTLDLRQEIQQTVETNPLLEIDESIANANLESLDAMAERERMENDSEVYDPFNDDASFQGADIDMAGYDGKSEIASVNELMGSDSTMRGSSSIEYAPDHDGGGDFDDFSSADHNMAADLAAMGDYSQVTDTGGGDLPDKLAMPEIDPGSTSTQENLDNLSREDNYSARTRSKGAVMDDDGAYEGETQINLHDHLTWQLDCSPLKGRDRYIAEVIIDGIDDSGYLTESLDDLLALINVTWPEATIDDVNIVLKLIQNYDPLGVGARSVQECLLIQLKDLMTRDHSEEVRMANEVVSKYLDLLSNHDYRSLCSKLGVKEDVLKKVNDVIVSLTPRPGRTAIREKADYIVPDVLVVKDKDGDYDVILNPDALPRVRLNEQYRSLACYARNEREKEFFKSNLQEANWFIQSMAKRNDTLLKVARCIVDHQKAFLDYGEHRMEPLVLNDIAQEISMHESTISRVTTEKYLYTMRGTFELKYFFSSHVSTESGGTASSTAIRAEIKSLVSSENPRRPYSDNQIASLLKEKGFCVARRTIAKYREALGIGSSSQRKRLV
ncbi:RNA polymerase factor sigma-54 [Anaerobiospirillum sp. NML120511]|nr:MULTISPECIES: RNA polymerase factor sigma-54 [unclassified Anaerobiospirillum]MCK0525462.1 RNA polymerase factor sigma-54 [Anaerobiospirillum sp. NML120449]MCK0534121.1 RNA polymerase factor sigma-54 [Anaerobiospirillum sp. NML120511]MCK0539334.1 RNA polymerase factor sigma-54 [Anaerobiospirillum sp. NML02-A-032]